MRNATGPLAAFTWLAAVACGVLTLLALYGSAGATDDVHFAPAALLLLAVLLLFPPLWGWLRNRPLNAMRIAVAFVVVFLGLFLLPLAEHDDRYVPPPQSQN